MNVMNAISIRSGVFLNSWLNNGDAAVYKVQNMKTKKTACMW